MPKQQQSTEVKNADNETSLAIAYETFKTLGWDILFAGENRILGHTQKTWAKKGQQVLAEMQSGLLIVQSEMVNGESFDITGINKKNDAAFIAAFKNQEQNISAEQIEQNKNELIALKEKTRLVAEQEAKDAEEINNAMHLKGSNLYATYGLIAANLLIFILMVFDGAGVMEPNSLVHIKWGSNYSVLTLSGDWWRLITNIFIHFGIIHVLFNMYALYMVGVYLEPMLGKTKYLVAYFCTGVIASLTSLWWHKEGINSAGASGAIFGMFGLFLALLTTDLIPKKITGEFIKNLWHFHFV
ncbi:MAG: rhomboid family intramembrane serine protease [Ferruginibacter sp.]